jgi:hypothetical protein
MGVHQTISMNAVSELLLPLLKKATKIFPVSLFKKNILPRIPTDENMVDSPGVK